MKNKKEVFGKANDNANYIANGIPIHFTNNFITKYIILLVNG